MLTNHVTTCDNREIQHYLYVFVFVVVFHLLKWCSFCNFHISQFSMLWRFSNVVILYLMCVLLVVIKCSITLESNIVKFNATVFSQENLKYMRDEPTITNAFSILKINRHPISLCLTRSEDFCLGDQSNITLSTQLTQHDCLLPLTTNKKKSTNTKLI